MSWYSKVVWSEGLFLRQHHLQQHDRHVEHLIDLRVRSITPYPWGFSHLAINRDLAEQNRFGLLRATGIFPDGTPFDLGGNSPPPPPIEIPEGSERRHIYLVLPDRDPNGREIDMQEGMSGSRYFRRLETIKDTTSAMHLEEEIEVAHPRAVLEVREKPKPGHNNLVIGRVIEVRDRTIVLDETFCPPVLACHAHPVPSGWLDRVTGWIDTRLESLARYASDPSSGGGLQTYDYFMLQMLNREINVLKHLRQSQYTHPETVFVQLLRLAGELSTFSGTRLAQDAPRYDHDNLRDAFEPLLERIQRLLSLDIGRAIRLDLKEMSHQAYLASVTDRTLFRNARFVLEVASSMPLTQIQMQVPDLVKIGPNTRMRDIVNTHLPGIPIMHMPTPPRQIRHLSDHVYFQLDRTSPLWPEFSVASGIGIHFAGNWPALELELWAIMDDGR